RRTHHPERGGRAPARGVVVSALFFFPRGGSAQVTRALSQALAGTGWQVRLAAGSLGGPGAPTNARSFYSGTDVSAVDYSPALRFADPLAARVPFQPSYEARPTGPDRVFAAVDGAAYEPLVAACERLIVPPGAEAEVAALCGLERFRLHGLPSGVELDRFRPRPLAGEARRAFWQRWLVECPQGWDEQGRPGSVAYHDEELSSFA